MVLLNCTNQLVMHVLNARLREIVERAGILEPGQAGGRQVRSTDVNLAKLEWVTRETLATGVAQGLVANSSLQISGTLGHG